MAPTPFYDPRARVPALEPLHGPHVVADPSALDGARWHDADVAVLRLAPRGDLNACSDAATPPEGQTHLDLSWVRLLD